jgi:hypothetical protein
MLESTSPIDVSKVYSVYVGKDGCRCGCRGTYSYASAHREFASKNRGYEVTDDEINDKRIASMTKKINKLIAENSNDPRISDRRDSNGGFINFTNENGHAVTIYFIA